MEGLSVSAVQRGQSPWTIPNLPTENRSCLTFVLDREAQKITWIIYDEPDTAIWVRKVSIDAHLSFLIVDASDETFIEVTDFLEDVDYSGNILTSDVVGEDLYSVK